MDERATTTDTNGEIIEIQEGEIWFTIHWVTNGVMQTKRRLLNANTSRQFRQFPKARIAMIEKLNEDIA